MNFAKFPILLLVVALGMAQCAITRADLVINGNFEIVGGSGPTTTHSGTSYVGESAAHAWSVFHQSANPGATTETNLRTYAELGIPTIFGFQDGASDHVLRVETSHANNGLVQVWSPLNTGPAAAVGGVYLWVEGTAQVGVGMGNGGSTSFTAFTNTNDAWEFVPFTEFNSPVNEMIIYSSGGSATFYVDFASVDAVPEPSSIVLPVLGLVVCGLRRRKVRNVVA